jgi:hypothetical protein
MDNRYKPGVVLFPTFSTAARVVFGLRGDGFVPKAE